MAFYEHRLPTDIEKNAVGGPRFKTRVNAVDSGQEQRNIDWVNRRGEWDLAGAFMYLDRPAAETRTDVQIVLDLFHAQQGRAHGFRYKDPADFKIGDVDNPTTDNQSIGTGDTSETAFQVFKRYTFGAVNYDRDIKKLVTGKAVFLLDNVVKTVTTDYTVDLDTGIVTWNSPPGAGVDVQCAVEFDVPVRFDIDHLEISAELAALGQVPSIPIVELRIV